MKRLALILTLALLGGCAYGLPPVQVGSCAVADSATDCDAIPMKDYTLINLDLPNTLEGTTLNWKCSDTIGGTAVQINDDANAACANTLSASTAASVGPPSGACALAVGACKELTLTFGSQTGASTVSYTLKR